MSTRNSIENTSASGSSYNQEQIDTWKKTFEASKQPTTAEILTPIPLRTLTTLLNYERCISNPRFRGVKLLHSTFARPTFIDGMDPEVRLHVFGIDSDSDEVTGTPSMNDIIHPDASPELQTLTFAQRESIYHESRGHDGCYKAILLYQHFFDLCPAGQKLSIQIKNEAPVLVDPSARKILEFKMNGPKLLTISTGLKGKDGAILTGLGQESSHSVLGFSCRGSGVVDFVVDMTRMQWGEAGRGSFGETYYLGTEAGFVDIMADVCDGVKEVGHGATHVGPSEHTMTMEACATRVWERWNNRDKEGWCDYCGVGASERLLLDCSACKETKLRYCCKEHQRAAWKLHKFTCEKKKT